MQLTRMITTSSSMYLHSNHHLTYLREH